jgi:hypothetical protein
MNPSQGIAIVWDWQNVNVKAHSTVLIQQIMSCIQELGDIKHKWIFADWNREKSDVVNLFDDCGFIQQQATASRTKKNNADKKLMNCVRKYILNNTTTQVVFLMSGDGDFERLAKEIKSRGKRVIIVARSLTKISRKLLEIADDAIELEKITSQALTQIGSCLSK